MKTAILTPAQSIEARENLNLQQPIVVSGVKAQFPEITFTKTYLSEFESGSRNLPPKTLRCLRDYYEEQGHEFADLPETANDPQPGDQVRVVRDALIVCDRLTHSQRGSIQDRVRDLLAGLQSDLRQKAREGFIFSLYSEETEEARDKAIAVLAEIGVLYATLFDNCPFKAPSEAILKAPGKVETISDVVSIRFAEALSLASNPDSDTVEQPEKPAKSGGLLSDFLAGGTASAEPAGKKPNTRGDNGGGGASGSGSNDPALDGDGTKAATPPAAIPKKKPATIFG